MQHRRQTPGRIGAAIFASSGPTERFRTSWKAETSSSNSFLLSCGVIPNGRGLRNTARALSCSQNTMQCVWEDFSGEDAHGGSPLTKHEKNSLRGHPDPWSDVRGVPRGAGWLCYSGPATASPLPLVTAHNLPSGSNLSQHHESRGQPSTLLHDACAICHHVHVCGHMFCSHMPFQMFIQD